MKKEEALFILESIVMVAEHGWKLLPKVVRIINLLHFVPHIASYRDHAPYLTAQFAADIAACFSYFSQYIVTYRASYTTPYPAY